MNKVLEFFGLPFTEKIVVNLGNGFCIEVEAINRPPGDGGHVCNFIKAWDCRSGGTKLVEKVGVIKTLSELRTTLSKLSDQYRDQLKT